MPLNRRNSKSHNNKVLTIAKQETENPTKSNLDHVEQTDDVGMIDPPEYKNLRHETIL